MLKWTHPPTVREPAVIPGAGKITAVEPDPRRKGAVKVYCDGEHRWTAALTDVEEVRVGVVATEQELALLDRAADTEAALRSALRHLARRAFARMDLDRRLRRKGHPPEAAQKALEALEALKLLDDEAFARSYVATRAARGRGPLRVQRDLGAMGVERAIVDRAIAEAWPASVPPEELARTLAAKRLKQLGKGLTRQALRRRLVQYLGRRGFGGATAGKVVGEVLRVARG
ncbi:MAG TPA: regulatory protein RecX [Gemmatimonadales bacterium]|nr:regulatory protein RecX [Gemmatimonadales bacterium]